MICQLSLFEYLMSLSGNDASWRRYGANMEMRHSNINLLLRRLLRRFNDMRRRFQFGRLGQYV